MGNAGEQLTEPRRTFGQITKQAGLFVLFATILVIPRIRRLRRRVWVWSGVRLGVAVCATWLGWRYTHAGAGVATLVLALLLFAFSLLLRAKPEETSVDALARELNALIVLNGGEFRLSPDSIPLEAGPNFRSSRPNHRFGTARAPARGNPLRAGAEPYSTSGIRREPRCLGSGNRLDVRGSLHNQVSI